MRISLEFLADAIVLLNVEEKRQLRQLLDDVIAEEERGRVEIAF